MTQKTLVNAILEAQRFLKIARDVKYDKYGVEYGKASAACKRASMDLTRALAEMRRA